MSYFHPKTTFSPKPRTWFLQRIALLTGFNFMKDARLKKMQLTSLLQNPDFPTNLKRFQNGHLFSSVQRST